MRNPATFSILLEYARTVLFHSVHFDLNFDLIVTFLSDFFSNLLYKSELICVGQFIVDLSVF